MFIYTINDKFRIYILKQNLNIGEVYKKYKKELN